MKELAAALLVAPSVTVQTAYWQSMPTKSSADIFGFLSIRAEGEGVESQ